MRLTYPDGNVKANEFLYRRLDIQDAADAHRAALRRAPSLGFGRYIVSATTPFTREDLAELRHDAPSVVARLFPGFKDTYARLGWSMFASLDRVYVNTHTRADLDWAPRYGFRHILDRVDAGENPRSPPARTVGAKGYHDRPTGAPTRADLAARRWPPRPSLPCGQSGA